MTKDEVIAALNAIEGGSDAEESHIAADDLLLAYVDPEVKEAYDRMVERHTWWAYA